MSLTSTLILSSPDYKYPFISRIDASNYVLGVVLLQGESLIVYASRLLTVAEHNCSTTERLANIWAVD